MIDSGWKIKTVGMWDIHRNKWVIILYMCRDLKTIICVLVGINNFFKRRDEK